MDQLRSARMSCYFQRSIWKAGAARSLSRAFSSQRSVRTHSDCQRWPTLQVLVLRLTVYLPKLRSPLRPHRRPRQLHRSLFSSSAHLKFREWYPLSACCHGKNSVT